MTDVAQELPLAAEPPPPGGFRPVRVAARQSVQQRLQLQF